MTTATAPTQLRTGDGTEWRHVGYWNAYEPDTDDPDLRGVLRTWEQLVDIHDGQVSET